MKVLFLDIDGVLNSVRSAIALGGYPHPNRDEQASELIRSEDRFDLVAVGLIRMLCQKTDTKIVLSSTWRYSYQTLEDILDFGKKLDLPIICKTPIIHLSRARGREIDKWLQDHPDVTKFAIVDDDSDMLPEQLPSFVKTDYYEGLSYQNYLQLLEILK